MAETRTQNQPSGQQQQQRGVATRPGETGLTRDWTRDIFNPFSMMRRLSEEMDRAFGTSFGLGRPFGEAGVWSPPIEIRERENEIEIDAELPGMSKDDVKVEVTDEGIVIEGEKKCEEEAKEGGVRRSERCYGRFVRMISLPEGAETDKIRADFKNGILQVRVPLSEQHRKARRIPINA